MVQHDGLLHVGHQRLVDAHPQAQVGFLLVGLIDTGLQHRVITATAVAPLLLPALHQNLHLGVADWHALVHLLAPLRHQIGPGVQRRGQLASAHLGRLFRVHMARVQAAARFGNGLGDPGVHGRRDAQNRLGPWLAQMHGTQLAGQGRIVVGHRNHQPHPAPGQRVDLRAGRVQLVLHGQVHLGNQLLPLVVALLQRLRAGPDQGLEFVGVQVLVVHVHHLQKVKPISGAGHRAHGQHALQLAQTPAQRLRLAGLLLQMGDLAFQQLLRRVALLVQRAAYVGQAVAEFLQRLNAVQSNQVGLAIAARAAVRAQRRRQQTNAVVMVQCAHREAGTLGQLTDLVVRCG